MATEWQRVRDLLEQVCDLAPTERLAILDARCHDDDELRREVESVLSAMDKTPDFLCEPASFDHLEHRDGRGVRSLTNERVGPYRIRRFLAAGGMSDVYLACRDEDRDDSQVAIKIIRRPLFDDEVRRRFAIEREALAALEHPNIARLIETGVTDDGFPFLAIEYIDGEPIHKYCDARRMTTDDRLTLFGDVCAAVSHAHQHLIVHRDLKPGNILVTRDGRPKLLDFGIAKLIDTASGVGSSAQMTATAHRVFTPEYASPEQFKGQTVSTSTDVYSLGIVLYELLTGRRPFQLGGRSRHEIERTVCESIPEKPSTVVTDDDTPTTAHQGDDTVTPQTLAQLRQNDPTSLRRRIEGDLDAIVMAAIRKEPDRRYASVQQLSGDIELHQKGLPITARPDTPGYRIGKFIRRHRLAATMTTVIAVVAIIGAIGIAWHMHQLGEARILAEATAVQKESVSQFLQEMFDSVDPMDGRPQDATVRGIVDNASMRIDQGELDDQGEVKATLLLTLGRAYAELGDLSEAEKRLTEACQIRNELFGHQHADVAECLNALCVLTRRTGQLTKAERLCREALTMRSNIHGSDHLEVAESLNNLGVVLRRMRKLEDAEFALRQALVIRKNATGDHRLEVATSSVNLAVVLKHLGQLEEAETLYRDALDIFIGLKGLNHISVAGCMNNLALLLRDTGELEEATSLLKASLQIRSDVFSGDHPSVATGLHNLALIENDLGSQDDAKEHFADALEMRRRMFRPDHPGIANATHNLASLLADTGETDEAEPLARDALRIRRARDQRVGSHSPRTGMTLVLLADIAWQRGDCENTRMLASEGIEVFENLGTMSNDAAIAGHALLGLCQLASGNEQSATRSLESAVTGTDNADRVSTRTGLRLCALATAIGHDVANSNLCTGDNR